MRLTKIIAALLTLVPLSLPAAAQQRDTVDITVGPRETVRVVGWFQFDTNCQPTAFAEFVFADRPIQSTVRVENESRTITTVSSDDRRHCIGRSMEGRAVYLEASSVARGTETFTIIRNPGMSYAREITVNVTYR